VESSVAVAVSKLSLRRSHDGAPELTVRYISRISLGVRSGRHRTCFTLVIVPSGISLASCRSRAISMTTMVPCWAASGLTRM
jgi:hypothetical protein